MALKKSDIYNTLWKGCDELRGGMDSSQYKDYVLFLLFLRYVSDKYGDEPNPYSPVVVPKGAGFKDLQKLKGKAGLGDAINKHIVEPLKKSNSFLGKIPDFNDENMLGKGKEMVDRLTNLITIFEDKSLDFSGNRSANDDLLGDAYEYLMRNFAQQSGKSKGQFYTPSEVSRVIAKVIGINHKKVTADTIVYDPTCGSGSLLLKVVDEMEKSVTIYGQEKDIATKGLANMNMVLHNHPTAQIAQGNTLTDPFFLDGNEIKRADYVVANPPFSDKSWMNGLTISLEDDSHHRFKGFGIPPAKNGDYAYLLHIIKSMKSIGKGACILPHGVLFRGNVEAKIRKNLVDKGYIKGIIGLPANLFYGTGIPACILVLDKEQSSTRKSIFMIDAGKGFMKDGDKNRLRSMDIHKIVDVFNHGTELDKYSRAVPYSEIVQNDYNLNIPRYIDTQEEEDTQDIQAHLIGEIPGRDLDSLSDYWSTIPSLKKSIFKKGNVSSYFILKIDKASIKKHISEHPEFLTYSKEVEKNYKTWKKKNTEYLKNLQKGCKPKQIIHDISEDILKQFSKLNLIDQYDVYQYLMNYWDNVMQDDCYLISADGWTAKTERILVENKKGDVTDKGWFCDLVPKEILVSCYFSKEKQELEKLETDRDKTKAEIEELEEEHSGEDGFFSEMDKVNKKNVQSRLKEILKDKEAKEEIKVLKTYITLCDTLDSLNKDIKEKEKVLDEKAYNQYPKLSMEEVKTLVVDHKWMQVIEKDVYSEMDRISQKLSQRLVELAERYETALPELDKKVDELEMKVSKHLKKMGVVA
jgi:type I restriction enzyme M protein